MKLVELNYIWVFIFSTNSMYCEMWSEKHSFPGCLSWNPTRMVTSEQCGGCPDTAKCHPGAECHLSEKTSDVFFFVVFLLFRGSWKVWKNLPTTTTNRKIVMLVSWNPLCSMEQPSSFTKHNSIHSEENWRVEPSNHEKPSKPIF